MPGPFEPHSGGGRKRNSCKAVIVRGNSVLLTVNHDHMGDFYLLPGGGQEFGETLTETVVREVLEETGWLVEPGDLVLSRDYIGAAHEFAEFEGDVHQTEMVFMAVPLRMAEHEPVPDPWQTGIEWLDAEKLREVRIYPSILKQVLPDLISGNYRGPIYLGDVN